MNSAMLHQKYTLQFFYIQVTLQNGEVAINFVAGKSRVTPLKPITLSRLDLRAAVLLSRLYKSVKKPFDQIPPLPCSGQILKSLLDKICFYYGSVYQKYSLGYFSFKREEILDPCPKFNKSC